MILVWYPIDWVPCFRRWSAGLSLSFPVWGWSCGPLLETDASVESKPALHGKKTVARQEAQEHQPWVTHLPRRPHFPPLPDSFLPPVEMSFVAVPSFPPGFSSNVLLPAHRRPVYLAASSLPAPTFRSLVTSQLPDRIVPTAPISGRAAGTIACGDCDVFLRFESFGRLDGEAPATRRPIRC